jgi:UDP-glucose 4,6-dehydratase
LTGIYNFCNPGAISHNQVLTIYREEVDPDFQWENFSIEEQAQILAGPFFFHTLSLTHSLTLSLSHGCMYIHTYIHKCTYTFISLSRALPLKARLDERMP